MTNLIDSLTPHKLSGDETNEIFQSVGEALKNEELPTLTCYSCHKNIIPNEKGDNFYDDEGGTYCSDCQERAEVRFEALKDEI